MWQEACKRFTHSVHAILLETPRAGRRPRNIETIGTSFSIKGKPDPFFITNAHVICKESGEAYDEKNLILAPYLPDGKGAACGIGILFIEKSLDIAVFRASEDAESAVPAVFAKPTILEVGTPVASIGFPIPPKTELYPGGGKFKIIKRLATGFISGNNMQINFLTLP
jgi:hypothetical protein